MNNEAEMIEWLRATYRTEPYVTTEWSEAPGKRVIIISIDCSDDPVKKEDLYADLYSDPYNDVAADYGYVIEIHDDPDFVEAAFVPRT